MGLVERTFLRNYAIALARPLPPLLPAAPDPEPRKRPPPSIETIEAISILSGDSVFFVDHAADAILPMDEVIKMAIEQAIVFCRGDKEEAARRLGINLRTLDLKLSRYERQHRDD